MADIFLGAGLARIDNLFMKTRRLFNAFERPVGTSSGHNAVWHGYSPYNPRMVQKYLAVQLNRAKPLESHVIHGFQGCRRMHFSAL